MAKMHHRHAELHAHARLRERRHRLAHEAAKLMAESGIRDFQQAKRKAAQRLGFLDDASLPRNTEVQDALREYQRLFLADSQPDALRRRRQAAHEAMDALAALRPLLAGAVADGTADAHAPVCLHLHTDEPDQVHALLHELGIPARLTGRRVRLDRQREQDFDAWQFEADGLPFELVVLPLHLQRQPPLSPVDERPMQRLSRSALQTLLALEPGSS